MVQSRLFQYGRQKNCFWDGLRLYTTTHAPQSTSSVWRWRTICCVVCTVTGMRTLAGTHKLIYIAAFLVFLSLIPCFSRHPNRLQCSYICCCFSPQTKPWTGPLLVCLRESVSRIRRRSGLHAERERRERREGTSDAKAVTGSS